MNYCLWKTTHFHSDTNHAVAAVHCQSNTVRSNNYSVLPNAPCCVQPFKES